MVVTKVVDIDLTKKTEVIDVQGIAKDLVAKVSARFTGFTTYIFSSCKSKTQLLTIHFNQNFFCFLI